MYSETEMKISDIEKRFGVVGKASAVCETHGDYISIQRGESEATGCPFCAKEKSDREAEEKRRRDFIFRHARDARIPKRFADKSFEDYKATTPEQRRAAEICADYADDFSKHRREGRCLLLLGKLGTGKTHLAIAIATFLLRECLTKTVYRTVGDILADIRATYDSHDDSEAHVLAPILSADLLVLDEVGATKASEFELATPYRIINHRYERCLPIVVVSNLAASELGQALGERCLDRVRENGAIVVPFTWESARKGIAQ